MVGPTRLELATFGVKIATGCESMRKETPSILDFYLYGEQSGLETADAAIEELQLLQREHPDSREVAYNLGAVLAERRRAQATQDAYRAFLKIEPEGIHAEAARDYLGTVMVAILYLQGILLIP